jgi:hypothetical protein
VRRADPRLRDRAIERNDRADTSDRQENEDITLSRLAKLATEQADPADAIERIDPTEPIDRTDPAELMERIDPVELIDHSEPRDRLRVGATEDSSFISSVILE